MDCDECGAASYPVWAHYNAWAMIDGHDGRARFRLPMRQCPEGHISGWRPGEDFFIDLAIAEEPTDLGPLGAGTVDAKRALVGRARCGQCGEKLRLESNSRRLEGTVRMPIHERLDHAEFDVDLPAVACRSCAARPNPHGKGVAKTAADIELWLFELIAAAMPPDRAERVEPREES